jgi:hypothetical protein
MESSDAESSYLLNIMYNVISFDGFYA